VAARVAFSTLVILLGLGAGAAIAGFSVGVAAVVVMTPGAVFRDVGRGLDVMRERARWGETGRIATTQLIVSAIISADVLVVAMLDAPAVDSAGYQALSALSKGPAYLAAGAAVVAFPLLRDRTADGQQVLKAVLRSFALLAFPTAAVIATVPDQLALLVIPHRYAESLDLLPALAVGGFGYAAISLVTTILVALRGYRRCYAGLLAAVVLMPVGIYLGWRLGGIPGVAIAVAAASLTAALVLWFVASPLLPPRSLRQLTVGVGIAAVVTVLLVEASRLPVVWLLAVLLMGAVVLRLRRVQA
jgi:O-antigen/teichoic acid export membrane protein